MKWDKLTPPLVCCTLLTADRQAYTERAIECFLHQTYKNKRLLVLDNGREPFRILPGMIDTLGTTRFVHVKPGNPVGSLRNLAAELATDADIIAHWDSDDWSAPGRLSEQVERLLYAAELDLVAYDEMFFYRRTDRTAWTYDNPGFAIGSSMTYWREAWARRRFEAMAQGEDQRFQEGLNVKTWGTTSPTPMMIAEHHGANTSKPGIKDQPNNTFTRAPHVLLMLETLLGYE